jgi:hypothetical protein
LLEEDYYSSFNDFTNSFKDTRDILTKLYEPINLTIIESFPDQSDDEKDYIDIKKNTNFAQTWFDVYDTVASRYHYTLDQFIKLTNKQIDRITKAITKNRHSEIELQAGLHGVKLKGFMNPLNLSKEQRKKSDDYAKEINERLQKKFEENKC